MKTLLAMILSAVFMTAPLFSWAEIAIPMLPPEPPILNNDPLRSPLVVDATYDWRQNFFYIFYDLYTTGDINYMTARRVLRVGQNEYSNTIVELLSEHALFYWFDINGDGKFRHEDNEMWIDPEEDGVNGNEQQYHLPPQDAIPPAPR